MNTITRKYLNILMVLILLILIGISFYSSFSAIRVYTHTIIAPIVIDCVIIYLSIAKIIFKKPSFIYNIFLYGLIGTTVYLNYISTNAFPENYVRSIAACVYIFLLDYLIQGKKENQTSIINVIYHLSIGKIIHWIRQLHNKQTEKQNEKQNEQEEKQKIKLLNKKYIGITQSTYPAYEYIKNNIINDDYIINKIIIKNIPLSLLTNKEKDQIIRIIDEYIPLNEDNDITFNKIISNKNKYKTTNQKKKEILPTPQITKNIADININLK